MRGAAEAHAGLSPANCRLIDGEEAPATILARCWSSASRFAGTWWRELSAAQRICRKHAAEDIAERRRFVAGAFLQAPYLRDILVSVGAMAETFETATTLGPARRPDLGCARTPHSRR